jgi:glycosyltransferase involved in cell wall biosynthesis
VVTSTDRRGAEVFAVDLGDALSSLGHEVRTVALASGATSPGIDVPVLGPSTLGAATLRRLRSAARSADVVVAHGSRTLPACALALAGAAPFVYRNIGDPTAWSGRGLRRRRTRLFLARSQAVVALTDRAGATLRDHYGVAPAKITVIPTGASAERHRPADARERAHARESLGIPAGARVAAVIGALSEEKDVSLAIDAVALLPDVHLVVAGDGPERPALEGAATARVPGRAHFTGALADPSPAFAAADVVALTSRTEGLPGVLIEAGLRGLPSVTTDVGYVRDIVVDGETGVVVLRRDAASIAAGITRVLAQSGAGARARARCVARFELAAIAQRWSALLQRQRDERSI